MNGVKKSDGAIVPSKRANNGVRAFAEPVEERASTKGNRRTPGRTLRLGLAQRPAQPPVLVGRQEPLARTLPVVADRAAGVASGRYQAPGLGLAEHPRQHPRRPVRDVGMLPQAMVELRRVFAPDRADRLRAERGEDVPAHDEPVEPGRARLAVHRHVGPKVALGQLRDRELRRRKRILPPLQPVDRRPRTLSRLVGGEIAVLPERHPPRPVRPAGLDHVDLAAGGMDPDAEPGEVAVPERGVALLHAERLDGALADPELASPGHPGPPFDRAGPFVSVIKPSESGIGSKRIRADGRRRHESPAKEQ